MKDAAAPATRVHAFLRIDDFPSTGYEYASGRRTDDAYRRRRLESIVRAASEYGVVPEFMVCSHVIERSGAVHSIDEVFPKTTARMRQLSDEGKIIINAHGMFHLREKQYLRDGTCDVREFTGLDEITTSRKLDAICEFIWRVFRKEARGFVAPAWGYEPGVTKRVASRYFDYIADSYQSWRTGMTPRFGTIDPEGGFVHFPETWPYGPYSLLRSDAETWKQALMQEDAIHFMQHGFRVPGEWRKILEGALISCYGRWIGQLALRRVETLGRLSDGDRRLVAGTIAVAVGGVALAAWNLAAARMLATVAATFVFAGSLVPLIRFRSTSAAIRDLWRANLRTVLAAAARADVRWGTLEELAREIKRLGSRAAP